jgi:hypothetical protein
MAHLRSYGFNIYCQICILLLLLFLRFGMIIWVLLICLSNLSSMLVLSMMRLINILYVTKLLKRSFRFSLFLPRISLHMFLQNPSQLLLLQFLGSSFGLNIHPQLEGGCIIVYYILKACIYLEKLCYSCIVIFILTIVYYPTYTSRKY